MQVARYALIIIGLAWACPGLCEEASTVRITQVDGTVEIRKGGSDGFRPAKEGEPFERGDLLACREKSAALLLWSNGSMLKVYPDTEVGLAGVIFELDKKVEKTVLDLAKGRIFAKGQVPEHIFCEFKVKMGPIHALTQGAEFALTYDPAQKSYTAWPILGRIVTEVGTERIRVEEGQQGTIREGQKPAKEDIVPITEKTKQALWKVSKELGGSLLLEDEGEGGIGGKLVVKIGGVRNRRGNAPYKVDFKVIIKGGSGKVKSIKWDFGDGESANTKAAEHTFTQGMYMVILRVEDENGEKGSAQIGISAEEDCNC